MARARDDAAMTLQQTPLLVVPLDTSRTAEAVLPWAALVARDRAMEVRLLTVWSRAQPIPGIDPSRADEEVVADLRRYLEDLATDPRLKAVHATAEVRVGDVVAEIAAAATERPGSIVMLASHGQGGYHESYIGSTTDKLLRLLRVPVMVIPAAGGPG
jgi:nucleotide-binding universal stress UspA family protein